MTKLLLNKCGLQVGTMTLHEFVQRRSRPRKPLQPEVETVAVRTSAPDKAEFSLKRIEGGGSDPYAEVRARMARDKALPVQPKPAKAFEYTDEDSIKPIILLKPTKEK